MSDHYPALVYRGKGAHQRAGGTYAYKLVENQVEFDAALADGWFATLPVAIEQNAMDVGKPQTRAELEQKANELGIKFNDKTSNKRLICLIEEITEA